MKKNVIAVLALTFCIMGFAQTSNDYLEITRDVLKTEKKAAIAEVMDLSETESQPFWNLYNEYEGKLYNLGNKRIEIIQSYADNYENLSNEKADQLIMNYFKYEADLLKLKKNYYKQFKKILPAGKAAKFFQAESKIEAMVDAKLALEIPMMETN